MLLLLLLSNGGARDLHVPSASFPSISAAVDFASDGDNLILAAGVFAGAQNCNVTVKGKGIKVRGAGADQTIIDCGATGDLEKSGRCFRVFGEGGNEDVAFADMQLHGGVAEETVEDEQESLRERTRKAR